MIFVPIKIIWFFHMTLLLLKKKMYCSKILIAVIYPSSCTDLFVILYSFVNIQVCLLRLKCNYFCVHYFSCHLSWRSLDMASKLCYLNTHISFNCPNCQATQTLCQHNLTIYKYVAIILAYTSKLHQNFRIHTDNCM